MVQFNGRDRGPARQQLGGARGELGQALGVQVGPDGQVQPAQLLADGQLVLALLGRGRRPGRAAHPGTGLRWRRPGPRPPGRSRRPEVVPDPAPVGGHEVACAGVAVQHLLLCRRVELGGQPLVGGGQGGFPLADAEPAGGPGRRGCPASGPAWAASSGNAAGRRAGPAAWTRWSPRPGALSPLGRRAADNARRTSRGRRRGGWWRGVRGWAARPERRRRPGRR